MLVKLLFIGALILFVGRSLFKMGEASAQSKPLKHKKNDDDAIDADYTVIDDDK